MALMYHSPGGITIRQDREALFGYLPKEGFAFFAPRSDFDVLKSLLAKKATSGFPLGYERLLKSKKEPFSSHSARQLGDPKYQWETLPLPETPLVINWMITGKCNHHCIYCYAQDVMAKEEEPTKEEFLSTIKNIKSYNPIAVAISGGEPTLSPYFETAINEISKFTSVIVDTNATAITNSHIDKFIKNNVHVRISIDSNRHAQNAKTRCVVNKKESSYLFELAWKNLSILNKNNAYMTINTVATKYNYNDIIGLEKDISRFSVSKLRVRLVENTKIIKSYENLTGTNKTINRFIEYTKEQIKSEVSTPIYFSMNRQRNSIVIVSPKGNFFTESQFVDQGKILIDQESPTSPCINSIRNRVDMHAHSARYLFI